MKIYIYFYSKLVYFRIIFSAAITSHHITSHCSSLYISFVYFFNPDFNPTLPLLYLSTFHLIFSLSPSTYSSNNSLLSSILLSIALTSPSDYSYFYPYLSSSLNSFLHSFLSHLSALSSPHFFLRLLLSLSLPLPTVLFFRLAEGGCTYARTKSVQRLHRQV